MELLMKKFVSSILGENTSLIINFSDQKLLVKSC